MAHFTKPAEGSWTEHFQLDTAPVSYDDSISPDFYELERDAVFRRTWLNVGRVEQLPKNGSYFTKALALEFGPKGITVNTIPPGFIDTPMLRRSDAKGLLGEGVEHHAKLTPVRRVGRPEDIAAMTSFLVRDEASYITGQVLGVNGGRNT